MLEALTGVGLATSAGLNAYIPLLAVALLGRDPLLAPVTGVFAAQEIKPQARVLAEDRGIRCVVVDYNALRGAKRDELTLF